MTIPGHFEILINIGTVFMVLLILGPLCWLPFSALTLKLSMLYASLMERVKHARQ